MNRKFFSAKNVTVLGVLLALVIVLQAVGGSFSIGPVQLNFTLVPIVLGALTLGPMAGGLLGLACGIVVMIQVIMGLVPFYTLIWTETPIVAALTCLLKTTVAGFLAGYVYRWTAKKNRYLAVFLASATVPIVNTLLFMLGCLGMWNAITQIAGGTNVFVFVIITLIGFNFFVELALNLVVSPALYRIIRAVGGNFTEYDNAQEKDLEEGDN